MSSSSECTLGEASRPEWLRNQDTGATVHPFLCLVRRGLIQQVSYCANGCLIRLLLEVEMRQKFVNLGVDHWSGPPRPSTPFVKAAHWSGARDKFL